MILYYRCGGGWWWKGRMTLAWRRNQAGGQSREGERMRAGGEEGDAGKIENTKKYL